MLSLESLAAVATIIGTIISVLALMQSSQWLVFTSLPLVCIAIATGLYARHERKAVKAAHVAIEGRSIDALNVANLQRRVNRTLFIQEAHHKACIDGRDLKIEWVYSGFCRANRATAMEFSIEAEPQTPFEQLDCSAYDLVRDPEMRHAIRPLLIGPDGLSKKISVPFLEPLGANQGFGVKLRCTLPNAMKPGFGYYCSTLSFAQKHVKRCIVQLLFTGAAPAWVRVYSSWPPHPPELVKTLKPEREGQDGCKYVDEIENAPGQSARVYAFWRD